MSSALTRFEKALREAGGSLSFGYGIKSPLGMKPLGYTEAENAKLLSRGEEKICRILEEMESFASGKIERTWIFENGAIFRHLPVIAKLIKITMLHGAKSLNFQVTEDCIRCRVCERRI